MDRQEVFDRARSVMCRIFKIQPDEISEETRANEIAGWDSLTHLILITGLEKKFDVELPMAEAYSAQNVGELIQLLRKKLDVEPGNRA